MKNYSELLKTHGFSKLRRVSDESDNESVDEISIPTSDGKELTRWFKPSEIGKHDFCSRLRDIDAKLPIDSKEVKALHVALLNAEPMRREISLSKEGWSKDSKRFGRSGAIIGKRVEGMVGTQAGLKLQGSGGASNTKGTPQAWTQTQGAIAGTSSTMMLMVSAAFAAPLLAPMDEGSFSICVVGPSRVFKSTACLIASSLVGISQISEMPTWSLTEANLQELLPSHNDMLFPIDDLATLQEADDNWVQRVDKIAYHVASGQEKGRHSSYQAERGKWRSIMITQNEFSIASAAAEQKGNRKTGAALRLIDVPVILGNANNIFDRENGSSFMKSPEWRDKKFLEIVKSCKSYHGAAFDAYIVWLIEHRNEVTALASSHSMKFTRAVSRNGDDDQLRDLTRKFGLLFAGAMMGISAGIVDWKPDAVLDAIIQSYRGARRIFRPLEDVDIRKEFKSLVTKTPFLSDGLDYDSVDGYRTKGMGELKCVLKKEVLTRLLDQKSLRGLMLQLEKDGMIAMTSSRKDGKPVPQEQAIWPDGKRRRSITILKPINL